MMTLQDVSARFRAAVTTIRSGFRKACHYVQNGYTPDSVA